MEKLYITINYTQQVGDIPIWNNGDIVEILVANKDLYLPFVVTDATRIEDYQKDKELYIQECNKVIDTLCDSKQLGAKEIIANKSVSTEQDARYKSIAKHARNATGRNTAKLEQVVALLQGTSYEQTVDDLVNESKILLQPLADAENMDIDTYADYIVGIEYVWSKGIDTFYIFIEEFKKFAYVVLAKNDYTNFIAFWEMMEEAKDIGKTEDELTPEEMIALIRTQLDELKDKYS